MSEHQQKSTALAPIVEIGAVRPVMTVDDAVTQLQQMREFRKRVLQEGVDFGVIPGTGTKPTLLKPGAEKLAQLFGFSVEFERAEGTIEDWERGFFNYAYRCTVTQRATGATVAVSEGSANSKEDKYRWRNVPEWELPDGKEEREALVAKAHHSKRRNTRKGWRTFYYFENDEPFSLVNTLQKMAQKRAMIGSMLIATRASEEFTQDVEDLQGTDYLDGEAHAPQQQESDEPASEKQLGLLRKLMGSSVFSDAERAQAEDWIASPNCTRKSCSSKIDEIQAIVEQRKAKKKNGKSASAEKADAEDAQLQRDAEQARTEEEVEPPAPAKKRSAKKGEPSPESEIAALHEEIAACFDDANLPERTRATWEGFYASYKEKPKDIDAETYLEELRSLRTKLQTALGR